MKWADKVTVVTGAGSGIGQAIVRAIAAKGGHIALVDMNAQGLEKTLASIQHFAGKYSTHCVDVSDVAQMEALPAAIVAEHQQIDVLFNNAGLTIDKSFAEHSLADWQKIIGVNLWGVIYGYHFFLPYLEQRPEAHIATTSSLAGFMGLPKQSSYSLTKAGVRALNEAMYAEYKFRNIHVTSVHPGAIRTNLFNVASASAVDQDASRKFFEKVEKFAMPVDKAAAKIVRAVEKKKQRVRVGKDAVAVDVLKRLLPVTVHKLFASLAEKQLS